MYLLLCCLTCQCMARSSMCSFDSLNPRLKMCSVCVCVCVCVCARACVRTRMLDAYSKQPSLVFLILSIGRSLCFSGCVEGTFCCLDHPGLLGNHEHHLPPGCLSGVFVLTSLGSLSLIGSALTAPFQTLMEGHSMDLNSWHLAAFVSPSWQNVRP